MTLYLLRRKALGLRERWNDKKKKKKKSQAEYQFCINTGKTLRKNEEGRNLDLFSDTDGEMMI